MPPAGNKRERSRLLELAAWELRAKSFSTRTIGGRLGISHTQVIRLLRRTEARLMAESEGVCRAVKVRQAEQLEHWLSEAAEAWEASKKPPKLIRRKTAADGTVEETVEDRTTAGDVKFISEARSLLESERKLWGLSSDPEESKALDADALRDDIAEARRRNQAGGGTPG